MGFCLWLWTFHGDHENNPGRDSPETPAIPNTSGFLFSCLLESRHQKRKPGTASSPRSNHSQQPQKKNNRALSKRGGGRRGVSTTKGTTVQRTDKTPAENTQADQSLPCFLQCRRCWRSPRHPVVFPTHTGKQEHRQIKGQRSHPHRLGSWGKFGELTRGQEKTHRYDISHFTGNSSYVRILPKI